MKDLLPREMVEATDLTRAGHLGEATALIQRMLRGIQSGFGPAEGQARPTAIALPAPMIGIVGAEEAALAGPAAVDGSSRPNQWLGVLDRLNLSGSAHALQRALKRAPLRESDVAPASGRFLARSFGNDAGSRSYKLYVPSRYDGRPRPLIVMLHGCTQSPDDFAAGTRMNFAAEERDCFVVYPEQSAAANSSKCWNWFKSGNQQRGSGEPKLIAGITRQVMSDYAIDERRIYIAGLSAGGAAAAIVGEAYPELYAAVGVHSGLACGAARDLPSAFAAMRGTSIRQPSPSGNAGDHVVPTIVFHGDRDATVHPRNGAEVIARANAGGSLEVSAERETASAGHKYTHSIQRDANGRPVLELWELHGMGHAWSGGNPIGSFTDPKGPDATKEMLRFFLEHARLES
jgi:poly(hydroxyalkanoate) depolymerase family esterase